MKKLITNHKFTQKMFLAIMIILLLNFIVPTRSQADVGGVLMKPITGLLATLGDAVCSALQLFLVDGQFFQGGNILTGFLISSHEDTNSNGVYPNYPEINYDPSVSGDAKEYVFYTDDVDIEGWDWLGSVMQNGTVAVPVTKYTADAIFSGKIPALDINFINPTDWTQEGYANGDEMNKRSVAYELHETIAKWYVSLRNLAIVGLMIILVYVGIRMVISSTASDKAKYKQLMLDWLVAMCLLFSLHYIMSFTITITQEITNAINGNANTVNTIPVTVYRNGEGSTDVVTKFNTSLMGVARFQVNMKEGGTRLLYTIIYLALVIYTCMFTFTYLKRVITVAFLTLMAPLVAFTYPIDKMNDGSAQAFNMWLKEYIFNALLQPFHLIIYTIFISSAMGLASTNPIYAIVALAFITPAEKIMRKFFGFDKASTAGSLGAFAGMAGGAAAYKMLGNAVHKHKGKPNESGKNIRTKNNRQLEDPNAPSGVDGFTGNRSNSESNENEQQSQNVALERHRTEGSGQDANSQQTQNPNNTVTNTAPQIRASNSSYNNKPTKKGVKEGVKGAGRAIKGKVSTTLGNKHWWKQTAKKAGKGAIHLGARAASTVAIGSAGLAAGIAGDNLEDVLTYGIGGATLGATVGGNAAANAVDRIGSGIANSSVAQGFVGGFTGTTAMERELARQKEENMASSDFQQQVNEYYGDGELSGKELSNATERAADLFNSGITDPKKMAKALKMEDSIMKELDGAQMQEEEKKKIAREQATAATKMADKITDPTTLVGKRGQEFESNLAKRIKNSNPQLSDNIAKANAAEMMKRIKKIKGI